MANKFDELRQWLQAKVDLAKSQGYEICFADECMFTRQSVAKGEWAKKRTNVEVDLALLNEPA